jgi:DNA-binding transcriptional MerR regulator
MTLVVDLQNLLEQYPDGSARDFDNEHTCFPDVGTPQLMNNAAVAIPEKLFFKIGEVCDLTGVQAHVLRYWESEFPMLSPQKNRAGQRTYRKRDVEIALRIKELLYDDQYTIAGAKKRLASELRNPGKLKVVTSDMNSASTTNASSNTHERQSSEDMRALTEDERDGIRDLARQLNELLSILNADEADPRPRRK